jgi:hypothetical protein
LSLYAPTSHATVCRAISRSSPSYTLAKGDDSYDQFVLDESTCMDRWTFFTVGSPRISASQASAPTSHATVRRTISRSSPSYTLAHGDDSYDQFVLDVLAFMDRLTLHVGSPRIPVICASQANAQTCHATVRRTISRSSPSYTLAHGDDSYDQFVLDVLAFMDRLTLLVGAPRFNLGASAAAAPQPTPEGASHSEIPWGRQSVSRWPAVPLWQNC